MKPWQLAAWNLIQAGLMCFLPMIGAAVGQAQTTEQRQEWNQPVRPFRIIGSVYYVGASDIASYLIVTPAGDIVLDGGFVDTAPQIEANIRTLGFKLEDLKILLNSHAHFDHAGGLAELKKSTGARSWLSWMAMPNCWHAAAVEISFLATPTSSLQLLPIA